MTWFTIHKDLLKPKWSRTSYARWKRISYVISPRNSKMVSNVEKAILYWNAVQLWFIFDELFAPWVFDVTSSNVGQYFFISTNGENGSISELCLWQCIHARVHISWNIINLHFILWQKLHPACLMSTEMYLFVEIFKCAVISGTPKRSDSHFFNTWIMASSSFLYTE